jgi:hypothetical protein
LNARTATTQNLSEKSNPGSSRWKAVGVFLAMAAVIAIMIWFWPPKMPAVRSGTLQLWLRADAGVVADAEGRVSRWKDQSGHTNNASQENPDNQPLLVHPPGLGGKPAIRFNGNQDGRNGDYLQGTKEVGVPDAMTSFIVYNALSATNTENVLWMIGVPGVTYGACRGDMITGGNAHFTFWAYDYDAPFQVPTNTYRIRTDRVNGKLDTLNVFDNTAGSSEHFKFAMDKIAPPGRGYYVGGLDIHDPARPYVATTRCFDGEIVEMLVYRGYLTESDRLAVLNYLKRKYFQPGAGLAMMQPK